MSEKNFQLVVQRGPEPGKVYSLSSVSVTIGRDPMADITITDPEVSRQHVRLTSTPAGYSIQDLGSTNGTYIDGQRLSGDPVELVVGQIITMGTGVAIQFQVYSEANVETATVLDGTYMPSDFMSDVDEEVDGALDLPEPEQGTPVALEPDEVDVEFREKEMPESDRMADYSADDDFSYATAGDVGAADDDQLQEREIDGSDVEEPIVEEVSKGTEQAVVIPHRGDPEPSDTEGEENGWRTPAIIVSVVLLVICCCCAFFLFIYYYGGDWMLRQMGLLP
ncbi:MAG: FHA domain-containing protein [Candidatus Promineifilaceae bacterium]|nr:FHA domain-containing protein [Candidatus Promineifilaceae bacterium]